MGQRERKAVFERDEVDFDGMTSYRSPVTAGGPIPDSVINVSLRKKKKMNNSSQSNDRPVKMSGAANPMQCMSRCRLT